jgi:hypothetical protein
MDPKLDMDATTVCVAHIGKDVVVDVAFGAEPPVTTTVNLVELLSVDKLDEDMARHPGLAAWWGTLTTRAQAALDQAELELDRVEGRLYEAHRLKAAEEKIPATNADKVIRARQSGEESYIKARERTIKLKEAVRVLEKISRGFEAREKMLVALGANLRQDWSRERILNATTR